MAHEAVLTLLMKLFDRKTQEKFKYRKKNAEKSL